MEQFLNNASDHDDEEEEEQTDTEQQPEESTTVTYDDETQKLIEQANQARTEYQEADRQVKDIESDIKSIQEYFEKDFGTEEEFAVLQVSILQIELRSLGILKENMK